ncbi:MAG: sigma-54-dependent Fis family transcriptional regulator [Deltaproteobacteria bacterium]|nr:sigma-54-dependent Fis family transcriptional regulator [Deltaproteobacteria bacterium]
MQQQRQGRRILVVEDDTSMQAILRFNLEEDGHSVTVVGRGDSALVLLPVGADDAGEPPPFDLVLTDVEMPGADGRQVLAAAQACHPAMPVVLLTAFGSVDAAVDALAHGAVDYVTKPFKRAELKARVAAALERSAPPTSLAGATAGAERRPDEGAIFTHNQHLRAIVEVVDRIAASEITVLVLGESGTGKELIAKRLHERSGRSGAFVAVNCAALPESLLESELFGHERGAFTGADRLHRGRFEQADRGTLLLDEIGELPLTLQAKILRVLEDGAVSRVGGAAPRAVDVRLVAATNRDLEAEVAAGRFRADLLHRISVLPLRLPALRERPEDVEMLAQRFLAAESTEALTMAPALVAELRRRPWPGNVRELRNLVQRMVALRRGPVLDLADLALPGAVAAGAPTRPTLAAQPTPLRLGAIALPERGFSLAALEREVILKALAMHDGNQSATARYLGMPRHALIYRLDRYARDDGMAADPVDVAGD